jgi:ubiquitin C-terminal hydrolase
VSRKREEKFLDLMVQVKGLKGIDESLKKLFEMEEMFNNDKIFCETCNEKTDSLMGKRIAKLPPVLTLALARFDLDYNTF